MEKSALLSFLLSDETSNYESLIKNADDEVLSASRFHSFWKQNCHNTYFSNWRNSTMLTKCGVLDQDRTNTLNTNSFKFLSISINSKIWALSTIESARIIRFMKYIAWITDLEVCGALFSHKKNGTRLILLETREVGILIY